MPAYRNLAKVSPSYRRAVATTAPVRPVNVAVVAVTGGDTDFPIYKASSPSQYGVLGAGRSVAGAPTWGQGDVLVATLVIDAAFAAMYPTAVVADDAWTLARVVTLDGGHQARIYWHQAFAGSPDLVAFRVKGLPSMPFIRSTQLSLALVRYAHRVDPVLAAFGGTDAGPTTTNVATLLPLPDQEKGAALVWHVGWADSRGDNYLPTDVPQEASVTAPWEELADVVEYPGNGTDLDHYRHVTVASRQLPDLSVPVASDFVSVATYQYGAPGARGFVGLVFRPQNRPLDATPLAPADAAAINLADPVTFAWELDDPDNEGQYGVCFRRRLSGSADYENWTGTGWEAETTTADRVVLYQPDTFIEFPAGAWSNGVSYVWNVVVFDGTDADGSLSTSSTVVGDADAPTVTVTGPATAMTGDATPTVSWAAVLEPGRTQSAASVRIVAAGDGRPVDVATAVADTFIVGDGTSVTLNTGLDDGDYVACVQVFDDQGASSQWASLPFTVALSTPAAPVLAVEQDTNAGCVTVHVTADAVWWDGGRAEIQRQVRGVWTPVRGVAIPAASSGPLLTGTVSDYEVEDHATLLYRARMVVNRGGGRITNSAWTEAACSTDFGAWWLKDPADPSRNVVLLPEWGDITTSRNRDEATFEPIGRVTAIVVTGALRGTTLEVSALTIGDEDAAKLDTLVTSGRTLWLADDAGSSWWVKVLAPFNVTTLATGDRAGRPLRRWTLQFVEQDRP